MKWEDYVRSSEHVLNSPLVPSSLDIITLIKKVNPTKLGLQELDRQRGYQLKSKLQNLLLEHYGASFNLIPHPASPNIILIKHRALPSIDACHANLNALSAEVIGRVETEAPSLPEREDPKRNRHKAAAAMRPVVSPKDALKKAKALLEEYDYAEAEEVLAGMQVQGSAEVPVLARGAELLLHEMGAYRRCINLLLNQSKTVLKDRVIRELLAVAYFRNGAVPEARAIFEELYPAELGVEALRAFAEIAFKDGNLGTALELTNIAKGRPGLHLGLDQLRKEIETAMSEQAEPVVRKAEEALQSAAYEEARRLAGDALDLYPNCPKARAVLSAVDAVEVEERLVELWARLERESEPERRIALLNALLERDKEKREAIAERLAEEKERLRRRRFDDELESLRGLVLQERWPECFDAVMSLMRWPEYRERSGEVIYLSPFFSVLHENRKLQSTTGRSAKELWLRFVKVKAALAAGTAGGCLETLEDLKPWFNHYPDFREDYLELLRREREKARERVASLIEQSNEPECTVSDVRMIFGSIRKAMAVLPMEERRELARTMEERLAGMNDSSPERLLQELREALQIGNGEKAAYLRQEIKDISALEAIEAEFAAAYRIDAEPLSLEFCDDLPVDLTTAPPLEICRIASTRVFLNDGEDATVMIDFAAKKAYRMTSATLAKAVLLDLLEDGSALFLEKFGEGTYGDKLWRANLSADPPAFTASFNVKEWFDVAEGYSIEGVMLSSERDVDYYVIVKHEEERFPARMQKRRLAPKGTLANVAFGKQPDLKFWRCSTDPDAFLVHGEEATWRVNRKVVQKVGLPGHFLPYKLDRNNGNIYGVEAHRLVQRGPNLEYIRWFESAISFPMWEPGRVCGISFQTGTTLVILGPEQQFFLDLTNNKFSLKTRAGSVIPFSEEGRFHCFDYNRKEGRLRLRDITDQIRAQLEWRKFFIQKMKRNKMLKKMLWFKRDENFRYRPDHWGPDGEPASW